MKLPRLFYSRMSGEFYIATDYDQRGDDPSQFVAKRKYAVTADVAGLVVPMVSLAIQEHVNTGVRRVVCACGWVPDGADVVAPRAAWARHVVESGLGVTSTRAIEGKGV